MSESETLLARLIAFDTTSRLSNLELIHFVRDYLAQHSLDCVLIEDRSRTKATLFSTIGPRDRPGFLLAGHTDVVPVDGQQWTTDPFQLDCRNGRLYGRGTADVAAELGISANAVRIAKARVLQRLRREAAALLGS